MYLGDFSTGSTVFFAFTTVNSTGAPTALSSGGITVYKNGSTVPDTTGVTLSSDFNGVTGLNHVQVDMISTSAFYAPSASYTAIISSGGVSGNTVAGYVVGGWSVKDRGPVTVSTAVSISTGSVIQEVTNITNLKSSDVKEQSILALSSDVYSEPTGVPDSTASLADKIGLVASVLRNKVTVSSSGKVFYTDAGAVSWAKVLSQDSTSSTGIYTEAEASTST